MAHSGKRKKCGTYDLLVVGSGIAGLAAALAAADEGARVHLVAAGSLHSGSSWWAQGGIAAALGDDDRVEFHQADTLAVGAALNDREAVRVLVSAGRTEALALLGGGVDFERSVSGEPLLGLEAGHTHRRILHAGGGATGHLVSSALLQRVLRHTHIDTTSNTIANSLIQDVDGRVCGVETARGSYYAHSVALATGGYAGLWARTTNPTTNRGQGLEMAWHAGATLADLEFVQFHPTALDLPGAPAYLLSEALRGEGALIVNAAGEPVVEPLLPRDVVARAIYRYRRDHGSVYLSLRHLNADYVNSTFESISTHLRRWNLDLATDLLPIAPAAHYCMGGVRTDTYGRTDVRGLYAAGEVACTGVQGANRLASNSLLECLVFGRRAALAALTDNHESWKGVGDTPAVSTPKSFPPQDTAAANREDATLGVRLENDLGVERNGYALEKLVADLRIPCMTTSNKQTERNKTPGPLIPTLAARSALLRTESRGAHYRTDYPSTSEQWRRRILWQRDTGATFEEIN